MKWNGFWYGTELIAEDEEDNEILLSIQDKIKREPEETYYCGKIVFTNKNGFEKIQFNRGHDAKNNSDEPMPSF